MNERPQNGSSRQHGTESREVDDPEAWLSEDETEDEMEDTVAERGDRSDPPTSNASQPEGSRTLQEHTAIKREEWREEPRAGPAEQVTVRTRVRVPTLTPETAMDKLRCTVQLRGYHLEDGWRCEIRLANQGAGVLKRLAYFVSPTGRSFKGYTPVLQFLEKTAAIYGAVRQLDSRKRSLEEESEANGTVGKQDRHVGMDAGARDTAAKQQLTRVARDGQHASNNHAAGVQQQPASAVREPPSNPALQQPQQPNGLPPGAELCPGGFWVLQEARVSSQQPSPTTKVAVTPPQQQPARKLENGSTALHQPQLHFNASQAAAEVAAGRSTTDGRLPGEEQKSLNAAVAGNGHATLLADVWVTAFHGHPKLAGTQEARQVAEALGQDSCSPAELAEMGDPKEYLQECVQAITSSKRMWQFFWFVFKQMLHPQGTV